MTPLARFDTKTLPTRQPRVGAHFRAHAMEHIHWVADTINANVNLLDQNDFWYENHAASAPSGLQLAREQELARLRTSKMLAIPGINNPIDLDRRLLPAVSSIFSPSLTFSSGTKSANIAPTCLQFYVGVRRRGELLDQPRWRFTKLHSHPTSTHRRNP